MCADKPRQAARFAAGSPICGNPIQILSLVENDSLTATGGVLPRAETSRI